MTAHTNSITQDVAAERVTALLTYSREVYQRGLVHASGGNTSVRIGNRVWITATGAVLGELTEADLSIVSIDGALLAGRKPSKELGMHLAMYQCRDEVQAIIHVHPTYSIALSTLISVPRMNAVPAYTAAFYLRAGRVPMTDYFPSGSAELHQAVADLAPKYHAILLRQHGIIVGGADMGASLGILEEVEQCCKIAILTRLKGETLTADQLDAIDQAMGRTWPE